MSLPISTTIRGPLPCTGKAWSCKRRSGTSGASPGAWSGSPRCPSPGSGPSRRRGFSARPTRPGTPPGCRCLRRGGTGTTVPWKRCRPVSGRPHFRRHGPQAGHSPCRRQSPRDSPSATNSAESRPIRQVEGVSNGALRRDTLCRESRLLPRRSDLADEISCEFVPRSQIDCHLPDGYRRGAAMGPCYHRRVLVGFSGPLRPVLTGVQPIWRSNR